MHRPSSSRREIGTPTSRPSSERQNTRSVIPGDSNPRVVVLEREKSLLEQQLTLLRKEYDVCYTFFPTIHLDKLNFQRELRESKETIDELTIERNRANEQLRSSNDFVLAITNLFTFTSVSST